MQNKLSSFVSGWWLLNLEPPSRDKKVFVGGGSDYFSGHPIVKVCFSQYTWYYVKLYLTYQALVSSRDWSESNGPFTQAFSTAEPTGEGAPSQK